MCISLFYTKSTYTYTLHVQCVDNDDVDGHSRELEYMRVMLSKYIGDSKVFQDQMMTDMRDLKNELRNLSTVVGTMYKQLPVENQTLIDKQMDSLRGYYWSLMNHINKVDNNINIVTGPWECGGTQGWRRMAFLDMTNGSEVCPPGWQVQSMAGKRLCGRSGLTPRRCDSTSVSVKGFMYSRVCGRITGYQFGGTTAFLSFHNGFLYQIDDAYVDGVIITHSKPRKHIWTLASGGTESNHLWPTSCPCDAKISIRIPKFVGNDYFCESGNNGVWEQRYEFYPDDPLWDGQGCTSNSKCCGLNYPPYFVKNLKSSTSSDIEVRLCTYTVSTYGNVLVERMELYVQ